MFSMPYLLYGIKSMMHRDPQGEWNALKRSGGADRYDKEPVKVLGFSMFLNTKASDKSWVCSSVYARGVYELATTMLFRKLVERGMNVVDIGAHIGYYTLMAATLVGEKGTVAAFEPEPNNFKLLKRSIASNGMDNVKAYNCAVTDRDKSVKLFLSDIASGRHSLVRNDETGKRSVEVRGRSLDNMLKKELDFKVDVMLIDAEGVEPLIVAGGKKFIEKNKPKIIMEYNEEAWPASPETIEWVKERFSVYKVINSPFLIKRIDDSEFGKRIECQNLLLMPK